MFSSISEIKLFSISSIKPFEYFCIELIKLLTDFYNFEEIPKKL